MNYNMETKSLTFWRGFRGQPRFLAINFDTEGVMEFQAWGLGLLGFRLFGLGILGM